MGTRILVGHEQGNEGGTANACLFDSVTMTAFGPVFSAETVEEATEIAERFLSYVEAKTNEDARRVPDGALANHYAAFRKAREIDAQHAKLHKALQTGSATPFEIAFASVAHEPRSGKHVKSDDPRKPAIVAAIKAASGGTKVTLVQEVAPGVFQGDAIIPARRAPRGTPLDEKNRAGKTLGRFEARAVVRG